MNKKLHTTAKHYNYEAIRDKVAIIFTVISNVISAGSIFSLVLMIAAKKECDLNELALVALIAGVIIFAIFGYITEYIEKRIVKKSKKSMRSVIE